MTSVKTTRPRQKTRYLVGATCTAIELFFNSQHNNPPINVKVMGELQEEK